LESTFKDYKNRREFEQYLFECYVKYYELTCNCDDGIEATFFDASSHYQRCNYWKFCHAVNRSLDWSELKNKKKDGIPPSVKTEGILPNEL